MARRPPRRRRAAALALGLAVLATPLPGQEALPARPAGVRAGDVVSVWIWREKDLTGEFPIDARGRVVLPLLGELAVAGLGADSLADAIRAGFQRFVTTPSIRVVVLRRIAVQGHVARPGLYPVDATITVGQAIALAGGVSASGDGARVRLRRGGRTVTAQLGAETVLERSTVESGDELFVPERGWLARNGVTLLWAGLSAASGILLTLVSR